MKDWIFISKKGADPFINQFAVGCNTPITNSENFEFSSSTSPIVFRGILKKTLINQCWDNHRDFYYMDTGYFGNDISNTNPSGSKIWHRIVKNNLQHADIISRPPDRWLKFNRKILPWKKDGRKILIAKPDEKPCKFYGINLDEWTSSVISTLKQYTDRPIEIRDRAPLRVDRIASDTFINAINNDVFAVVTFNSNAATEAIMNGIPAFVLAPSHAALPVASADLTMIETPNYATSDKLFAWACHLAYGQYHVSELKSGIAKHMLETFNV